MSSEKSLDIIINFQVGYVFFIVLSGTLLLLGYRKQIDKDKKNDRFVILYQIGALVLSLVAILPFIWNLRREKPTHVYDLPPQVLAF